MADLLKTLDGDARRVGDTYYGDNAPPRPFGVGARWRKPGDNLTYVLGESGVWESESWQTFEVATQSASGGAGSFFSAVEAVSMSTTYGFEFDYAIVIREIHLRPLTTPTGSNSLTLLSGGSILTTLALTSTWPYHQDVTVTVPAGTNFSSVITCSASFPAYNISFLWARTPS